MAEPSETVRLSPAERLRDSALQATSMSLPLAVHQRLTLLVTAAEDVAPTRAEIVGMLIAKAELDPDELESSLMAYRRKTVRDVLPSPRQSDGRGSQETDVVQITKPRPGRPRKVL